MQGQTNKGILSHELQRKLRNNMTDAEKKLWRVLRGRQFEGSKFRRQHPFEQYILDFVCLERKLVIEVDGGQHSDEKNLDADRTLFLEKAGFRVLRSWNHEVLTQMEAVQEIVWRALQENTSPDPSPPRPSP